MKSQHYKIYKKLDTIKYTGNYTFPLIQFTRARATVRIEIRNVYDRVTTIRHL